MKKTDHDRRFLSSRNRLAAGIEPACLWRSVLDSGCSGGVFAILVVKMLFGGLGQNFMNPALGARCFPADFFYLSYDEL